MRSAFCLASDAGDVARFQFTKQMPRSGVRGECHRLVEGRGRHDNLEAHLLSDVVTDVEKTILRPNVRGMLDVKNRIEIARGHSDTCSNRATADRVAGSMNAELQSALNAGLINERCVFARDFAA